MAATTDTAQAPSVACLQYMYEYGEWSDLSIVTATKTFKVHRSVVWPKNAALRIACDRDFREPRPSTVHWQETEEVVDAMLRHYYGLPVAWLEEPYTFARGRGCMHRIRSRGRDAVQLIVAARKYKVEALGLLAFRVFEHCLSRRLLFSHEVVVELGSFFLDLIKPQDADAGLPNLFRDGRRVIAEVTFTQLETIVSRSWLWQKLYAHEEYAKLVMSRAGVAGTQAREVLPRGEDAASGKRKATDEA